MKIERIRLPLSHRINVGEYESVEVAVELEAVLDDSAEETLEQAYQKLRDEVYKLWKQEAILTLNGVILRRKETDKPADIPEALLRHLISIN